MKGYLILVTLFFLPLQTNAAFMGFDNETDFNLANTAPLTLESFESFTPGDPVVISATDFSLSTSTGNGSINEAYIGVYPTDGSNYFGWYIDSGSSLTFTFNSPQTSFSMETTDLSSISDPQSISVFADGSLTPVVADFTYPPRGGGSGHGYIDFLALVSDTPFTTLQFTFAESEWAGVDKVQYGINPVPVPAAIWLFGTALMGFVGISRRMKVA